MTQNSINAGSSWSFQSIVEHDDNPCPRVNPYVVVEYLRFRCVHKLGAEHALARANACFADGEIESSKRPWTNVNPWHAGSVTNPRFEAHGYKCRWIENIARVGITLENYADKLNDYIRHEGWYADEHGDTSYRGVVLQVEGTKNYLIGYEDPDNSGAYLIEDEVYRYTGKGRRDRDYQHEDFLSELAKQADKFAESFAEAERERDCASNEVWHAKQKADEAREEVRKRKGVTDSKTKSVLEDDFCQAWDEYREAMKDFAEKLYYAYKWHGITLSDIA